MPQTAKAGTTTPFRDGRGPCRPLSGQSGFSLIEILISVVILTVGILGVSAMQTASLSAEFKSRSLDSCVSLAFDAIDRIQANARNITEYQTGGTLTVNPKSPTIPSGTIAAADYQALLDLMRPYIAATPPTMGMQMDNMILTLAFTVGSPVAGVDTVVSTVSWSRKGVTESCQAQSILRTQFDS
jgi:prepilin-type N-terminal cleavage/methylation domain-containing protein